MGDIYAAKLDFETAAKTLDKIKLESQNRQFSPDEKAQILVTIAEYWFEASQSAYAEQYIG